MYLASEKLKRKLYTVSGALITEMRTQSSLTLLLLFRGDLDLEGRVELDLAVVVAHAEAGARPEDHRPHPPLEQEHGEHAT